MDDAQQSCKSVLREYFAEYVEILDVDYIIGENQAVKADLVFP